VIWLHDYISKSPAAFRRKLERGPDLPSGYFD